jgi:pimeloyl-[acyl-carrier protein] methyl ester esterase
VTKIHQETFGQGKPLVLVHGWAMNTGIWRDFAKDLAKSYRVICVDLPGHGRSEKISPFNLQSISEALLESVLHEPCCWLGWSLGAAVVLDIADRFPERCKSIILLAGSPRFIQTEHWPGVNPQVLNAFAANLRSDSQSAILRFFSVQLALSNYKGLLAAAEYKAPDDETLLQGLKILEETDLRPALARLTQPVSVILGEKDTLIPAAVGQSMKELLHALELNIIENAGHVPFFSHRETVLSIITRFRDKQ